MVGLDVAPSARRGVEAAGARFVRCDVTDEGEGLMTPVYIDELVDCIVRALTLPEGRGEAFTAWDGRAVATAEFFGHSARMLRRDAEGLLGDG